MNIYQKVIETSTWIKDEYPKLTDFECLQIANGIVNTTIIADGLLVNDHNTPVALEAIAMSLGFKNNQFS